jgi:glycosyltransferase involved in cell wall biosynthesis
MKVLFVSNLYPNSTELSRGVFNSYQIQHLAKRCEVKVVAPIAWFPIRGRHAPKGEVPAEETLEGIQIYHPRHFYLPKVARQFNPILYARGIKSTLQTIRREFPFDIIFVNWSFPDACGVASLAAEFGVPFVTSVSGSDVHVYLTYRMRSRQIVKMFAASQAVTTRSQDLKNMLLAYRVPSAKVHAVYNGVDPRRFHAEPRATARQRLGWDPAQTVLLFVGRLSSEKGADDLLRALAHARRYYALTSRLVIVGDGPQRPMLESLAAGLGLTDQITWVGWKNPADVSSYMNAANFLCLPSQNEGVANVVLESFACGLPAVATAVGGIPEIMTEETGVLASPRQPESFAAALAKAHARTWDSAAIRRHAAHFSWDANAEHMHAILEQAIRDFSDRN